MTIEVEQTEVGQTDDDIFVFDDLNDKDMIGIRNIVNDFMDKGFYKKDVIRCSIIAYKIFRAGYQNQSNVNLRH